MGNDGFKQRVHGAGAHIFIESGVTLQRRSVDDRKIELFIGRSKPVEQVEGTIQNPVRARAGAVDLIDDHDGPKAHGKGFLRHKTSLRHRAVYGVHQQQYRVHHR